MRVEGRTAVITGAGGGIGRGTAQALAKRGCNLALADLSEEGLAETAALAQQHGVKVSRHRLDVAGREAVAAFPDIVLAAHGRADLLFNNAGVAIGGTFEQVAEEDFDWLMEINFWGVVRMTRAFLPLLRSSDSARIINISSIFGIIAPPGQTAYSASKFAVRAFSESLRRELEAEGAKIGVTVVHPGGVATSIAKNARPPRGSNDVDVEAQKAGFEKFLRMPPEKAGEIIVTGVEKDRPRVLVGNDARFMAIVERVAPVSYWKLLGRALR
ncbi:MAG TPA: SDR family NAD(P)-dependent oxidoreductase [Allosphingosinicella sp.]|nr:SDR family NAD(P)-dependent oxidoreductase [Allosphingosinicella sp.]